MITRRYLLGLALASSVLAVASCSPEPAPEPAPLPTPSGNSTTGEEDPSDIGEFQPTPTDEAASAEAADHAVATLEAFWDVTKGQDQWYTDFAELMTPVGGAPFEHTRIENVLPSTVTDEPEVTFLDEGNTAEVTVPSEQGAWTLTLYRDGDGWLTESIGFPKES